MLRRLGIRGKVLLALAIPVLVLFAAATLISLQSVSTAQIANATNSLVSTGHALGEFTVAIQVERQATLARPERGGEATGELAVDRIRTDKAAAKVEAAVNNIDVSVLGPAVAESLELTDDARTRLPAFRERVDAGILTTDTVDSGYSQIINAQIAQAGVLATSLADRKLASYLEAYSLVGRSGELLTRELPDAMKVVEARGTDAGALEALAPQITLNTEAYNEARAALNALKIDGIDLNLQNGDYSGQRLMLASGNASALTWGVDPANFRADATNLLASIGSARGSMLTESSELASNNEAAAVREAVVTIGATLIAVFFSVLIALLIARQIVVPLRRLTVAADELRIQLPTLVEQVSVPGDAPELTLARIPVTSSDEVGRLAAAFNDVNETTIRVAQEQAALRGSIAEMFVNVARRDQVLLNRQISFIDGLERTEEDPAALADLFRLDHLATRMRRNTESLLVLAGIENGRRVRDAMPLSDVIRTASSEIEQYDRITLELGADPEMFGHNALAAAHLLAELLENATVFSEPDTRVEVETFADGDYLEVQVRDLGLGMSDAELASAAEKLATTAASEVLGAQRLGFYVVARLAARLEAVVTLSRNPGGTGTIAVARFPASLFKVSDLPEEADSSFGRQQSTDEDLELESFSDDELAQVEERWAEQAIVPEAPVGVAVDLDALTNGATNVGLPRRRSRHTDDEPVEVPTDEAMIVLPALADAAESAHLAAELATGGNWAPDVIVPAASLALPRRAPAPSGAEPVELPDLVAPSPVSKSGTPAPRTGLFAGFRGRVVDAPPANDLRPRGLTPAAATPAAPEPFPTMVVPGLVPDDDAPWVPSMQIEELGSAAEQPTPQFEAVPVALPIRESFAAPVAEPVDAPVAAALAPTFEEIVHDEVAVAVAEAPAPSQFADFTAFSGYSAHAGSTADHALEFQPTLNEARAWGGAGTADAVVEPKPPIVSSWLPVLDGPEIAVRPALPTAPVAPVAPVFPEVVPEAVVQPVVSPMDAVPMEPVAAARMAPEVLAPTPTVARPNVVPQQHSAPVVAPLAAEEAAPVRRGLFARWRRTSISEPVAPVVDEVENAVEADASRHAAPGSENATEPRRPSWHTHTGTHAAISPAATGPVAPVSTETAPRWSPQREASAPEATFAPAVFTPVNFTPAPEPAMSSASGWAAERNAAARGGDTADTAVLAGPAQPSPAAPKAWRGVLDDEVAAMLALRSDIQEQALAELGQLSAYRPSTLGTGGGASPSLQRRVPVAMLAATEISATGSPPTARNAEEMRVRLSSFQSGTNRGRREAEASAEPSSGTAPSAEPDEVSDHSPASTW